MNTVKKIRNTILALVLIFTSNLVKSQINFGGGLAYGTEIESLGFNIRGGYLLAEKLNFNGGFTYFIPREENMFKSELWTADFDAAFWLDLSDNIIFYPMAGLNITNYTIQPLYDQGIEGIISDGDTETRVGLNLGGGLGYRLGNTVPFVEGKYIVSDFDQAVFNVGVLFMLQ
ncbi:MAG: hypothetical protein R3277_05005 [Brumimicrobium sp.]|nr:hypothetical protein [Brumimicrobium sp.]